MSLIYLRPEGAIKYIISAAEIELNRAWKTVDFLDLADHIRFDRNENFSDEPLFGQSPIWIPTSSKGFAVDDCRVLYDLFNSERHSKFHHHSMKVRDMDWIGRNVFLEYVTQKLVSDERYLEYGENSVLFLNLAILCGFAKWKESGTDTDCCSSHYVFSRIYPSVLRGLYNIREDHPRMVKKLWEMFCFNCKSWFMFFERIPDAQHLQLLLDVSNETRLDIWFYHLDPHDSKFDTDDFSYLNVIIEYIFQNRCDLIMLLLRYGLFLKGKPIDWLQSIFMGLWNSHRDFAASREFEKMLEFLFEAHPFPYLPPSIVKKSLLKIFLSNSIFERRELNANRGRAMLHELLEAHERVFNSLKAQERS